MCLFSLVITIFNDDEDASKGEKGLWSIFYSSPFEIESRQRTLPERKETNWSIFNPFLPIQIEKQYEAKNKDGSIQIIGSDINGLFKYLRSPQIRHKVFHPIFLMMKFRDSINLYYNKNLVNIQEGDNIFTKLQSRIFETLWDNEKLVFLNESKLFVLTLKRKDNSVALSKNEKKIIKHLKSLNGPIVNFMETNLENIQKNFIEMIYDEKFVEEYRKGFLQMSFIDFRRTKMDESEKSLQMEFNAVTKQNIDYNNYQNSNHKKSNEQNFSQTTISINHKYCLNRSDRQQIKCKQKDKQYESSQSYFYQENSYNKLLIQFIFTSDSKNSRDNNKRSFSEMMDQPKDQLNINEAKLQIEQMRKSLKKNDHIYMENIISFQILDQKKLINKSYTYDSDISKNNENQSDSDKPQNKDIQSDSDQTQSKQIQYDTDQSKINEIQSDSEKTHMNESQSDHEKIKYNTQLKHSALQNNENHGENQNKDILEKEVIKQNIPQKIDKNLQYFTIANQNEYDNPMEPNKQALSKLPQLPILHINNQLVSSQNTFIEAQSEQQQLQLQQQQQYEQQRQLKQCQQQYEQQYQSHLNKLQQQQLQLQLQFQQQQQNQKEQKQYYNTQDKQKKNNSNKQNNKQINESIMLQMGIPQFYMLNNQGTNSNQELYNIYPNQFDNFENLQCFFQNYLQFQYMQNDYKYQDIIQKQQQLIMDQQKIIDELDMKKNQKSKLSSQKTN